MESTNQPINQSINHFVEYNSEISYIYILSPKKSRVVLNGDIHYQSYGLELRVF